MRARPTGRTPARGCSRTVGYAPPGERSVRPRVTRSSAFLPVNYRLIEVRLESLGKRRLCSAAQTRISICLSNTASRKRRGRKLLSHKNRLLFASKRLNSFGFSASTTATILLAAC